MVKLPYMIVKNDTNFNIKKRDAIGLFLGEIKNSDYLKTLFLKNIKSKKKKKFFLNVTNIIFNFKNKTVEIQDDIGVTDERINIISFDKFIQLIKDL